MTADEIRKSANLIFKPDIPHWPDEQKLIWFVSEIAAQLAELNEHLRRNDIKPPKYGGGPG